MIARQKEGQTQSTKNDLGTRKNNLSSLHREFLLVQGIKTDLVGPIEPFMTQGWHKNMI